MTQRGRDIAHLDSSAGERKRERDREREREGERERERGGSGNEEWGREREI